MERKNITIEIQPFDDIGGDDTFSVPLRDAIAALMEALAKVPAEFQNEAMFFIRGHGDYVSIYPEVTYSRPETDDELETRRSLDRDRAKEYANRERAEYERLRKKFEP